MRRITIWVEHAVLNSSFYQSGFKVGLGLVQGGYRGLAKGSFGVGLGLGPVFVFVCFFVCLFVCSDNGVPHALASGSKGPKDRLWIRKATRGPRLSPDPTRIRKRI